MRNPYLHFVNAVTASVEEAKRLPLGTAPAPERPRLDGAVPVALIFSPHPDDECIMGTLPLRLLHECGVRIVNVAVTLGSRKDRRSERLAELRNACDFLGFELVNLSEQGLEQVNQAGRSGDPEGWGEKVQLVRAVLARRRPDVIFLPHAQDWNSTHEGTHRLILDALAELGDDVRCAVLQTEFWHPMYNPNLMVEADARLVADQVAATTLHVGEVRRNPYHLTLPAWMQDNVRRGAEIVGGQGGAAPDFDFATLYRLSEWRDGALRDREPTQAIIGCNDRPDAALPLVPQASLPAMSAAAGRDEFTPKSHIVGFQRPGRPVSS